MSSIKNFFFKNNEEFDTQLVRFFSFNKESGLDLGEVLSIARRIKEGDFTSWYQEWTVTAKLMEQNANQNLLEHHTVSARENYLRSSICYRAAEWFLRDNPHNEINKFLANKQCEMFQKGGVLFNPSFKVINIPFEGSHLPGYLFLTEDATANQKPTIIYVGGYDNFCEESFFSGAYAATKRGYNCLVFDGPGQGRALRLQNLYFRHDWEIVVKAIIDYALTIQEIDPDKLILCGRSFGGYLAPRAACFENRIVAVIADAALYDLYEVVKTAIPTYALKSLETDESAISAFFEKVFTNSMQKYFFTSRMAAHGIKSPVEYIKTLKNYSVKGIAKNIKCSIFISTGELDKNSFSQAQLLYEEVVSPKTLVIFEDKNGAGDHVELGAPQQFYQKSFDWIDKIVK